VQTINKDSAQSAATRHLSPEQLASRLNFCLETTRRKLRCGEIPALKFGRSWRIPVAVVEEYERRSLFPTKS
jgi:excisionase family DNA binding protein